MEYADGGDVNKLIENHKKRGTRFNEKELWRYFIQIVRGMKSLHDLKILHRDIKCANIFLNKDGTVKLGDLNVSKVAKKGLLHTQTGTPYYASPEVWKDRPYDNRSDIWSLGCVLYEMATLNPPFRAANMNGLYQKVQRGHYDPVSGYSNDLQAMIKNCLQVQPTSRPSCEKILQMP
jgi:NIMA (never in mitosis gene a)-related kinase